MPRRLVLVQCHLLQSSFVDTTALCQTKECFGQSGVFFGWLRQHMPNPLDKLRIEMEEIGSAEKHLL